MQSEFKRKAEDKEVFYKAGMTLMSEAVRKEVEIHLDNHLGDSLVGGGAEEGGSPSKRQTVSPSF